MSVTSQQLVHEAKLAKANGTTYYKLGAAVLTEDGKIFTGCTITNAVSPASMCAERVAIFKAVSEGYTKFSAIALVGNDDTIKASVCGICRQTMRQYSLDMQAHCGNNNEEFSTYTLNNLLPYSYGPNLSK